MNGYVLNLEVPPPHPALEPLANAAQALGLVPGSYSVQEVRDEAFYAARARSQETEARQHREVQAILDEYYTWPDYGKWETWKQGLQRFVGWIADVAANLGVGSWLLLCFLGALGVSAQFQRRRLSGFMTGLAVGAGLYLLSFGIFGSLHGVLVAVALLCSSGAVGLWAGGLALRVRRPRAAASVCAALAGAMLVLSGLFGRMIATYLWMAVQLPVGQWVRAIPFWPQVDPVRIAVGVVLIFAAAALAASGLRAAALRRRSASQD